MTSHEGNNYRNVRRSHRSSSTRLLSSLLESAKESARTWRYDVNKAQSSELKDDHVLLENDDVSVPNTDDRDLET
jgi:hypothetical protein